MRRNMLILLFSVFGCVFASPICTDEEANKCIPEGGNFDFMHIGEPFAGDEDHLTEMCHHVLQQLDCAIDFVDRCPTSVYKHYQEGLTGHKKLYAALCDRSNKFRTEYLEHIPCVNEKILKMDSKCMEHINFHISGFKCTTAISNYETCVEEVVQKECSNKSVDIFRALYAPRTGINVALCEQTYKTLKDLGVVSH